MEIVCVLVAEMAIDSSQQRDVSTEPVMSMGIVFAVVVTAKMIEIDRDASSFGVLRVAFA